VSGIVGGLVRGDFSPWRFSWLGGLATGALAAAALAPEAFYTFPETYSMARAVCGGEQRWGGTVSTVEGNAGFLADPLTD